MKQAFVQVHICNLDANHDYAVQSAYFFYLCKSQCERSSYFAGRGCGLRAIDHFLFPLPVVDFGTSVIRSLIVLTYYRSW